MILLPQPPEWLAVRVCAPSSFWEAASWQCLRGHLPDGLGSPGENCQALAEGGVGVGRRGNTRLGLCLSGQRY